ncbi:hypothetical protein DID99_33345 [Burkholderia sp. Bp8986]|nr:hypothetical protein DID99_33345 [Burkholderia sp. Bp8986]
MKSWMKWALAALMSVAASSAFADGSCQPGFGLRSYPFYDKAGAYIGMRQACAPIPCTPGYQDSTCAAPLRNGAIPQPQCQTSAGWTTVSASVWQGSRWSEPQCNYAAPPPGCPSGWGTASPATWTGTNWTAPVCTAPAQDPSTRDWASICNAAVRTYSGGRFKVTFQAGDFRQYQFGTGVVTMVGGHWGSGPYYVNGDYQGTDYEFFCAVRIDNGTIYQFYATPISGYQGG